MKKINVLILSGEGINCEEETAEAFRKAGAHPTIIHVQEWMRQPKLIQEFQILAFPGGFSYGDELHSGQTLALDLKYTVNGELKKFIAAKGLILGVCNGFQILMKLGIFEAQEGERTMTLFHNESFKFQDRWVRCMVPESRCVWTKGLQEMSLPLRHGEGRVILKGEEKEQAEHFQKLQSQKQVALLYQEDVNGSYALVAGLTDKTGQVLGLMPHPEAALEPYLYPHHYEQNVNIPLTLFKNAVSFAQEARA